MEADFSGYATKAGLKCSDGRTIMPDAFAGQDKVKVPLVWQHGHSDPTNVLGHAILENRPDGVYAYGFFNETEKAKHSRQLLEHGDITQLSIWANELVERSKRVFHGAIREVSLVLSGANPGALIENVTLRHSDGEEILDDEVIIYTGLPLELEHSDASGEGDEKGEDDGSEDEKSEDEKDEEVIEHADGDDETLQDIYDAMTPKQKQVLHFMVAEALAAGESVSHSISEGDPTFKEIYEGMSDEQKTVLHYMVGEAKESADVTHSDIDDKSNDDNNDNNDSKGSEMKHNVFEKDNDKAPAAVLSHADIEGIVADATKAGSLKEIDTLFPEARTLADSPELFSRRTEWVQSVISKVRKSPFSRIKTISADLTVQEARAKGYIKGNLKKEEFFRVSKRVTTPTTIYKKQKLDRDDMIDITDFDVVTWLKGEMRLMLDEELARAILFGDGRAADDEDKISEDSIRPVATDHELYTTVINVNIDDSNSSISEVIDAIVSNRHHLRGSGLPTMYTTESYIARYMLLKDTLGRRIYRNLDEVAAELRVESIVPVEVLEEDTDIVAILVNLADYVVGADRGGNVAMFDDFDIDYNQYKYLIETRASGALVKLKSAMVVRRVAGTDVLVAPAAPAFDGTAITITDQTGVVYRNADTDAVMNAAGSPYAVPEGETVVVNAESASGYYIADSESDSWSFTNQV
jgi:hypothetical protein